MKQTFFLAPAGTHVGLTTVALGLVKAMDRKGIRRLGEDLRSNHQQVSTG